MKIIRTDTAKTVLTISVGFLVLYLLLHLKWALTVSLIIGLTGIFSDYLSEKVVYIWLKFSWILSLIVPNSILTVVFFLFLFPIAILSRIFGQKDSLKLRHTSGSLFKDYNKQFDKTSFERPW